MKLATLGPLDTIHYSAETTSLSSLLATAASTRTAKTMPARTLHNYESDLVVLLDIDRTMICCNTFDSSADAHAHVQNLPTMTTTSSTSSSTTTTKVHYFSVETQEPTTGRSQYNIITCRPFLKEFLETVCSKFETHIFTAGTMNYAKFVVSVLDPHGQYLSQDRIWSRDDCQTTGWIHVPPSPTSATSGAPQATTTTTRRKRPSIWKDLSRLPLDLSRVVLIDDTWWNFKANPANVILVNGFTNDPHDRELVEVWEFLRDTLTCCDDVRPILRQQNEHLLLLKVRELGQECQKVSSSERNNNNNNNPCIDLLLLPLVTTTTVKESWQDIS